MSCGMFLNTWPVLWLRSGTQRGVMRPRTNRRMSLQVSQGRVPAAIARRLQRAYTVEGICKHASCNPIGSCRPLQGADRRPHEGCLELLLRLRAVDVRGAVALHASDQLRGVDQERRLERVPVLLVLEAGAARKAATRCQGPAAWRGEISSGGARGTPGGPRACQSRRRRRGGVGGGCWAAHGIRPGTAAWRAPRRARRGSRR